MKKIACYLLIVWFALLSNSAYARVAADAAHDAEHAAHMHGSSSHTASDVDADHADTCSQSHCGHGHGVGLVMPVRSYPKAEVSAGVPISGGCWASAATNNNIERPKWLFTTPTVVSLLT